MPQAVAAFALAVGATASTVAAAVGFNAAAAAAIGASVTGFVATLGGVNGLMAAASAWSLVGGVISPGTPGVTNPGTILQFKADPQAGIPYLMGRTATGGNIVARLSSNDSQHKWLHNIVEISGAGPIDSFEAFKLGDDTISFSSGAATGTYSGVLWMTTTTGPVSGWSLTQPSGTGSVPEWTSSHKLTGNAASRLILKADPNKFPGGGFDPPLWIVKGVKVYDPRLDSTYPGGSGSHRSNDESTWAWSDNPYLHALTWCIGRRQNGVLIMGIGAPVSLIDVAAFVDGANVADDNEWTIGGGLTSVDDRYQALTAMLQAGGGVPIRRAGLISCLVSAPKTPVASITMDDVVGDVSRSRQQARSERFNQITPMYVSEDHDWQTVAAAAYQVSDYVTDEGLRAREITYPLVQNATQATQLGAYGIYDTHETGPVRLSIRPRFAGVNVGEVITAELPEIGIEADLLVLQKTFNPETLALDLLCRTENADKHEEALGLTGEAPPVPEPTRPDVKAVPAPGSGQWALTSTSETVGSFVTPRIYFSGSASDNPAAEYVVFRYSTDGSTTIHITTLPAASVTTVDMPRLTSGGTYYGHVSYLVRGVESEALVLGPVVAGAVSIPIVGGGTAGGALVGDTIFDASAPGAYESPEMGFDGEAQIEIWGGGGSPGAPYLDPKTSVVVNSSGDGGDGGYSLKVVTVSASDTFSGSIGSGGETATTGGDTDCAESGQEAYGGGAGSADEYGSYGGAGGSATGGDTNTAGANGLDTSSLDSADGVWPAGGGHADTGKGATGRVLITRYS
jgi:hypothetical protein